jgi:hypothetical protein
MKAEITPAADWPLGNRIVLLDAYMRNPIEVKVIRHPNADHLVGEDERGVVYYARTDRVVGSVPGNDDSGFYDFSDILG